MLKKMRGGTRPDERLKSLNSTAISRSDMKNVDVGVGVGKRCTAGKLKSWSKRVVTEIRQKSRRVEGWSWREPDCVEQESLKVVGEPHDDGSTARKEAAGSKDG